MENENVISPADDLVMMLSDDEIDLDVLDVEDDVGIVNLTEEDNNINELILNYLSVVMALLLTDITFDTICPLPGKYGNDHKDRQMCILEVRSWNDEMFKRQFRLSRRAFNNLLSTIAPFMQVNETQAINSSGSAISPELLLLISLRILAGASYLDMIWYKVSVSHVMQYVLRVCIVINTHINNINFPSTNNELLLIAEGWQKRVKHKYPMIGDNEIMRGVVAAGDGIAFKIKERSQKEIPNESPRTYYNRKGYHAVVAQGFCDSFILQVYVLFSCMARIN